MEMSRLRRDAEERHFTTHDGQELFYRYWPALTGQPAGAVVLFHRGHEHSARMAHLVDELSLPDHAFFAWDARGHGLSPGPRGYSPSVGTSVRDIETFVRHIGTAHGIAATDIAVVAQSVGAVLAATWVHDYAPQIRSLVLASPAFKVRLYVPFARSGLKLMHKLRGDFFVNSYVKPRLLTHDPERIASYQADPLISRPISVNVLLGLYDTAERVVADAGAITVPTQLLISGNDWVVHQRPQHRFFDRLGSRVKEKHVLDGFFHDTLGEKDRAIAVDKVRDFVQRQFAAPNKPVSLIGAD
ncbi:MAG: lysophospholipase, partial [Pseudomonadota bacterium]